jgi:hypothetical protein
MDFSLVPRQDPDDVFLKVKGHIERLGFEGVTIRKLGTIPPSYAPLDSGIARAVVRAATRLPAGTVALPARQR